jgi:uncharacterized membrane protein
MGMALSLLSKENIGFIIPAVGLLGMIENWTPSKSKSHSHQNDRRLFIFALIIALSITWVIFSFKGLMPYFRGDSHSSHEIQTRLPGLGSTPAQIVENLLSHPLMALQLILTHALGHSGLHYLTLLFLPWAFFILKGGRWSLAALPGIMMNLISNKPEQISLQWHYELVIYPFLMMAVLEGIRKCKKNELLIGLFLALAFSERWPALELREQWPSSEQWQTLQWFYHIPKEGLLASTPDLFGPAATRAELIPIDLTQKQTSFEWVHQAQWVLLNQENPSHKTLIESLRSDWVVRSQSPFNQYILLERRHH